MFKPEEMITETDAQFDALPGPIVLQRRNPPRKFKALEPEFKGLRVKIVLARDPDYNPRLAPKIGGAEDVFIFMKPQRDEVVECLWAILLNATHRVVGIYEVARGALDTVLVSPADVLRGVLASGAHAFILVHNRPSGENKPSEQDIDVTARVRKAADVMGVRFLDHVVLGFDGFTSLAAVGEV